MGGEIAPPGCDFVLRTGHGATEPRLADELVGANPSPRQIHLGAGGDPRRNIAVTWRTIDNETTAGAVEFGTDALDRIAPSITWRYKGGTERVRIHEAHLCGLEPNTEYRYRVVNGPARSEERTFRTAPDFAADPDAEVVLAVLGDARNYPLVLRDLLTMLDEIATPDFVLFSGDWVYVGHDQDAWDPIFDGLEPVFARAPVFSAVGNHDDAKIEYFSQLALPGDEQFFSIDLGPAHVAVVDDSTWQNPDQNGRGEEYLATQLPNTGPEPWTFLLHHQPLYSAFATGGHGSTTKLRTNWEDHIVDGGVDLVFAGHDHKYERTTPQRGVTYVVSGGAGAYLYDAVADDRWTETTASVHHGLIVRVRADSVDVTAYDMDGTVIDSFMLTGP